MSSLATASGPALCPASGPLSENVVWELCLVGEQCQRQFYEAVYYCFRYCCRLNLLILDCYQRSELRCLMSLVFILRIISITSQYSLKTVVKFFLLQMVRSSDGIAFAVCWVVLSPVWIMVNPSPTSLKQMLAANTLCHLSMPSSPGNGWLHFMSLTALVNTVAAKWAVLPVS